MTRLILLGGTALLALAAAVLLWIVLRPPPVDVATLPGAAVAACGPAGTAQPFGEVECVGEGPETHAEISFSQQNKRGGWSFPPEVGRELRGDYFNMEISLACEGCEGPAAILATDWKGWTSRWQPLDLSEDYTRYEMGFEIPDHAPEAMEEGLWIVLAPPSPSARLLVERIVVHPQRQPE